MIQLVEEHFLSDGAFVRWPKDLRDAMLDSVKVRFPGQPFGPDSVQ
jgi:hypothetical protein